MSKLSWRVRACALHLAAVCCLMPLLGCRPASSHGPAVIGAPQSPSPTALERLDQSIIVHNEDAFADAARLCAQTLTDDELIAQVSEIRRKGPVPHLSFNQHLEDGLISALVRQGDEAVERLFRQAREDEFLREPAARLLYTFLRSGDDVGGLSAYVEADDALGMALRDAAAKAEQFRAHVPAADLADLQAIFEHMIPPKPQIVRTGRSSTELAWADSPYNPANWQMEALCESDPEHPLESLVDRDVRTFWAPSATAEHVGFRVTFPENVLIEHEVAYGIVILPGAKSSLADFEKYGRPMRIRLGFSDGTSKTAVLDYDVGEPRGRVDFVKETPAGREQVLLQTSGPALLVKPRLRWRHWTRELTFRVEEWQPGTQVSAPALSEIAIGPPEILPRRGRLEPLRLGS